MEILLVLILIFTLLFIVTAFVSLFLRVPYVPTKKRVMEEIIKQAKLKEGQNFYDLGCGDGRVLIEAEKEAKVNAVGYEIAPLVYIFAIIRKIVNRSKAKIKFKNFFNDNLGKADVIFCYLMPKELKKLAVKIKKECKKGTHIISNTFHIEGLEPVKVIPKNEKTKIPTLYFYQI
jgi:precorrin-6B methylase 2